MIAHLHFIYKETSVKRIILSLIFIFSFVSVQASILTCNVKNKDIQVVIDKENGSLTYNGCSASFKVKSSENDYVYSQGLIDQCDVRSITLIKGRSLTVIHKDGLFRYDVTCP